jgi:UDP-glucose 4-epimerase
MELTFLKSLLKVKTMEDKDFAIAKQKIAVVGAAGFIGRNLTSYLKVKGLSLNLFYRSDPIIENGNLKPDFSNADAVIWCASQVTPISAELHPDLVEAEVESWKELLRILKLSGKIDFKLIYLSSAGCTYTSVENSYSEDDPANGTNEYGLLKLKIEKLLIESGLNYLILRIANVYGPNQPIGRGQGVIAEWINSINCKEPIKIFGDLDSFRDYVFIDDLIEVIRLCLDLNITNQIINIGSGQRTTLRELLQVISSITKQKVEYLQFGSRKVDRTGYVLNIDKINRLTGWSPYFTLKNGIELCLK